MRHPHPAAAAPVAGGRLHGLTRLGVVGLLVLAVLNGLYLYLVPGEAEVHYAWSIKPPVNAAFFGAGYLAGVVATVLVVAGATRWRSLRILALPLVVLSVTLLAATLIHRDRFFWDYAPTWVWTVVYSVVPLLVLWYWRRQERAADPVGPADPRLDALRRRSAALGAVLALVAVGLFAFPTSAADLWPWPITPLLARAIAAWYALTACALLTAAVSLRRPHEVPIPYATLGAWTGLLLLLPALHGGDLLDRPAAVGAWLLVHVLLLALAVSALVRTVPVITSGEERL